MVLWVGVLISSAVHAQSSVPANEAAPVRVAQNPSMPDYFSKPNWSVTGGETVNAGRHQLSADIGWPGFNLNWLYGVTSDFNVGLHGFVGYSLLGTVPPLSPVVQAELAGKWQFFNQDRYSVSVVFFPGVGLRFNTVDARAAAALSVPVGFHLGVAINRKMAASAVLDVPIYVEFLPNAAPTVLVGFMIGGGFEYFLTPDVMLFGRLRMGDIFRVFGANASDRSGFALDVSAGIGWRP